MRPDGHGAGAYCSTAKVSGGQALPGRHPTVGTWRWAPPHRPQVLGHVDAPQTGRDHRWSVTVRWLWLVQWGHAWHISTCASRDCRWSEMLQWQWLVQWGRKWVCGDPIRWDPKVQVTCPRVGHVSVHAEGTWRWVVVKTCHRVGFPSSCPNDASPRTDGSKEMSVEAARATPCQQ